MRIGVSAGCHSEAVGLEARAEHREPRARFTLVVAQHGAPGYLGHAAHAAPGHHRRAALAQLVRERARHRSKVNDPGLWGMERRNAASVGLDLAQLVAAQPS
jgi:hypothetical protein